MPEQPRRDAPAAGDNRNPSAAADRPHDLPDGFFDRHHPEQTVTLGHRRIDEARTDVGDVKRESGFRGALPQSLGVVDLIGFRGVVGRSRSPAAQSADRRDDDQMSAAPPLETVVGPVCDRRPAQHVGKDGRLFQREIQRGIQIARSGADDAQIHAAQLPDQTFQRGDCLGGPCHVGDGKAVCSRIGLRDLLQQIFPAADQPHGISLRRKALRKAAADAGSGTDDNSSFHMRKDRTRKAENT